jgi:hypothetical protein
LSQKDDEAECRLAQKDKLIQDLNKTLNDSHASSFIEIQKQEIKKEYSNLLQNVENDKAFLQAQVKQTQREKDELQNQLREKREKESRKAVSSYKGKDGEDLADQLLNDAFCPARIEHTSLTGGKMDRHLTLGTTRIMIEVKAHEREIKTDPDVNKFKNNLHSSNDSSIGILLALHLNIPNYAGQTIETRIVKNKLEIYMNRVAENPTERLRIVASIIDVWNEYSKISQSQSVNDKCSLDDLKDWKTKSERAFENFVRLIATLNGHYTTMKADVEKAMTRFETSLETEKNAILDIIRSVDTNLVGDIPETIAVSKKAVRKKTQSNS